MAVLAPLEGASLAGRSVRARAIYDSSREYIFHNGAAVEGDDLLPAVLLVVEFALVKDRGAHDQGSKDGAITPFSTLVFDVELVKIKPIKHPAAPKPAEKKGIVKKHTTTTKKSS